MIQTFHYKYIKTPRFYWTSLLKISAAVIFVFYVFPFLSSSHGQIGKSAWIISFIGSLTLVVLLLFKKKYVNYLKINYTDKTIEAFYIKPFKECSVKADINNFDYSYKTVSYDLFGIYHWKVLKMTFNNNIKLSISQNEIAFSLETMNEIAEAFMKLKTDPK
jgi:hypothetical protein